jgi:hypothetical protein
MTNNIGNFIIHFSRDRQVFIRATQFCHDHFARNITCNPFCEDTLGEEVMPLEDINHFPLPTFALRALLT